MLTHRDIEYFANFVTYRDIEYFAEVTEAGIVLRCAVFGGGCSVGFLLLYSCYFIRLEKLRMFGSQPLY